MVPSNTQPDSPVVSKRHPDMTKLKVLHDYCYLSSFDKVSLMQQVDRILQMIGRQYKPGKGEKEKDVLQPAYSY